MNMFDLGCQHQICYALLRYIQTTAYNTYFFWFIWIFHCLIVKCLYVLRCTSVQFDALFYFKMNLDHKYFKYILDEKTLSHVCPVATPRPVTSVHRILQARMLEWVAIPFSRGSS